MFKYSVIIPFKDTLDLLYKALSSVPARDDIQIIIIDNSDKPTGPDVFAGFNGRKILYLTSSPLKGAGCARNAGIDAAEGKFVLFMDADDFFTESAFDHYDRFSEELNDITYFKATSVKLLSGEISTRHLNICRQIDDYMKSGNEDLLRFRIENPNCKMLLKSFIDSGGFRFDEVKCANDTMFSVATGYAAQKVSASNDVVYVITEGETGATLTSNKSRENQFCRFNVSIRRNRFLKDIGKNKYRIRLLPSIYFALVNFGILECLRYLRCAFKNKVNIFAGYFGI